jgi:hypothetical protein
MNADNTYGDLNAKHLYEVEYMSLTHNAVFYIRVHATNRSQAARIAERNGFTPRSVNMVG